MTQTEGAPAAGAAQSPTPPHRQDRSPDPSQSHASAATWVVLGRATSAVMSIAMVLILTRILEKGDFGRLGLVLMLYETLEMFALSGIPASLLFLIPTTERSMARSLMVTSALILFGIGLSVGVLLAIAAPWLAAGLDDGNPVITEMLRWTALYVVLAFPAQVVPNYLLATSRVRSSALFGLALQSMRFVSVLIPAFLGTPVEGVVFWLTISGLFPLIVLLLSIFVLDRQYPIRFLKKSLRQQFSYGVPLAVAAGIGKLNAYADKYMIGIMMPMESLAVYNVASRELPFVSIVPYGATTGIIPELARRYLNDKDGFVTLWRGLMRKVALLMYPVFVFFFVMAADVITVLYTDVYVDGANVFRAYLCLIPFRLCLFGGVLRAMGDTFRVLATSGLSVVANLLLNIPLYFWLGWIGPAVATVVGQLIAIGLLTYHAAQRLERKALQIFPWSSLARTLCVSIVSSVLLWPVLLQNWSSGLKLAVGAALYGVCYFGIGIAAGVIGKDDLQFIRTLGRKASPSGE